MFKTNSVTGGGSWAKMFATDPQMVTVVASLQSTAAYLWR
jgi:hypothetical protein